MAEYAKIWRNKQYENIELLSAKFKNFSYSKHWHDELAIGLIQEGVEGLDFNGSKIHVPQNHIVAINPGEVHTGFAGCDSGWTYRMFYFDMSLIHELLKEHTMTSTVSIVQPIINNTKLFDTLLKLHISLEEEHFSLTRDSLLVYAISQLFSTHSNFKFTFNKVHKDVQVNNLIKEYLSDNFNENISLEELSTLANRDKYQLLRNFKKQFGITPHQFLILLKTKKSKDLLEKGFDITDVALECGFFDQSHLGRNFKSIYGITPGIYKNSLSI